MGEIKTLGRKWLRTYQTDGVSSSPRNKPSKTDGIAALDKIDEKVTILETSQGSGGIVFASKAEMDAHLAYAYPQKAEVPSDATPSNIGVYQKQGISGAGSWLKVADLSSIGLATRVDALETSVGDDEADVITPITDNFILTSVPSGASITELEDANGLVATATDGVTLELPAGDLSEDHDDGLFAICDANGLTVVELYDGFSASEITARDGAALGYSALRRGRFNSRVQRPVFKRNHILILGQSLAVGQESWPALSKVARYGNVMLGNSVHGLFHNDLHWQIQGSTAFQPLVANTVSDLDGHILTPTEEAALSAGNSFPGENYGVGAANFAKYLWLQQQGVSADLTRTYLVTNCATGGQTISDLATTYFGRISDCANLAKTAATAAGDTIGLTAIVIDQGQSDYVSGTPKATYKAALKSYVDSVISTVGTIYGQTTKPAVYVIETAAAYIHDDQGISAAQRELCAENYGWFLVGSNYSITDKGGHLDPNGSRWMGQYIGKAIHEVQHRGRTWAPLEPYTLEMRGRQILATFSTPVPPLQFKDIYDQTIAAKFALTRGFDVYDASGAVNINDVAVVGGATVQILTDRVSSGQPWLRYARNTAFNGGGNLCDSDDLEALDNYEYSAGTGQYAAANIAALVGKPYPLQNFCSPFNLRITIS